MTPELQAIRNWADDEIGDNFVLVACLNRWWTQQVSRSISSSFHFHVVYVARSPLVRPAHSDRRQGRENADLVHGEFTATRTV